MKQRADVYTSNLATPWALSESACKVAHIHGDGGIILGVLEAPVARFHYPPPSTMPKSPQPPGSSFAAADVPIHDRSAKI